MFTALSHNFVLHHNCRIAHNSKDPYEFTIASNGTHHIQLTDYNATLWNDLVTHEKAKDSAISDPIHELPWLAKVVSGEMFGLVASEYSSSFKGLLEIKEEISEEDHPLIEERSSDAFDPAEMFGMLNIDPALVDVPLTPTGLKGQPVILDTGTNLTHLLTTSDDTPSMTAVVDLTMDEAPAVGSKRKLMHPEGHITDKGSNPPSVSKRVRIQVEGSTENVSGTCVQLR